MNLENLYVGYKIFNKISIVHANEVGLANFIKIRVTCSYNGVITL